MLHCQCDIPVNNITYHCELYAQNVSELNNKLDFINHYKNAASSDPKYTPIIYYKNDNQCIFITSFNPLSNPTTSITYIDLIVTPPK